MSFKKMVRNNQFKEMSDKPLEERAIPGISFKTLIWIAMAVISSYGWLLNSLNGIKQDLNTIKTEKNGDTKVNEVNLRNLENKIDIQGILIKDLQRKYEVVLENQIK